MMKSWSHKRDNKIADLPLVAKLTSNSNFGSFKDSCHFPAENAKYLLYNH